jgi:hypothetical protein
VESLIVSYISYEKRTFLTAFPSRLLGLADMDSKGMAKSKLRKFRKLEVFTAPGLVQQLSITYQHRTIEGNPRIENVIALETPTCFKIYMKSSYFVKGVPPIMVGRRLLERLECPGFSQFEKPLECLLHMLEDISADEIHESLDACSLPRTTIEDDDDDYVPGVDSGPTHGATAVNIAALALWRVEVIVSHAMDLSMNLFEPATRARANGPMALANTPLPAIRTGQDCEVQVSLVERVTPTKSMIVDQLLTLASP